MENNTTPSPNPSQEKVAKVVSIFVLVGTCIFGALGLSIAIVAITKNHFDESKEILQILLSTILPLFGTWIGTILAYYFSKENLAAANKTVEHLVNSITSDKKLATIKAKDVMIPLPGLYYQPYPAATDDATLSLKTYFLDFVNSKGIQRVILLDQNNAARYVLHKSTIEGFITEQYFSLISPSQSAPTSPQELTFADLKKSGNAKIQAILKDGVKFIKEDANLSDAKVLMKNFPACSDVFITKSGSPDEPIIGWITDKTISENSLVN